MTKFTLPKGSKPKEGKIFWDLKVDSSQPLKKFKIYRWSYGQENPSYDTFFINLKNCGPMILDTLMYIKDNIDQTLAFRKSCREGVCGSCAMNVDGVNTLACIKPINLEIENSKMVGINPLPHRPVVKDLIPDLQALYKQHKSLKPWLINDSSPKMEHKQSIQQRQKLDGLWECILCFCCSTSCPSYWWNETTYLGPANLLQIQRWLADSRDQGKKDRLKSLKDSLELYKCHSIMNCTNTCPKGLNPAKAIAEIKSDLILEKI